MRPWQMVKQKIHWTQWDWHRQEVSMEMWKLLESDGFFKLKERMALQMEMKLEFLMKVVQMMDEKQMTKMNHLRLKKHPQKGTNGIYNQPRGRSATQMSWAEMHYGFGTRDEDEHGDMVMIWLQRVRGQGMMMRVMASLDPKHGQNHWQNNDPQNRNGQSHADACWTCDEWSWTFKPSSSSSPPVLGIMNDRNYFLCSVPVANYFGIMPVPRAPDALDDYRWDQIMQGIGPEHLVVLNCSNLSNYIPLEQDPQVQRRHQRLLRNLQNLLVKFSVWQSRVVDWNCRTNEELAWWWSACSFFEGPDTEFGSVAEGEESETDDDPSQPGDGGGGDDDARGDGDGRGRPNYDYDEECPNGDGGSGEHHSRVVVLPSSSRPSSSFMR